MYCLFVHVIAKENRQQRTHMHTHLMNSSADNDGSHLLSRRGGACDDDDDFARWWLGVL